MSDTESENRPPFRNVTTADDLEENVNSLTTFSSAFHIRLLRDFLQLRAFKNYAVRKIASLRRFQTEHESVLGTILQLQKFQESAVTRLRCIEEKMDDVSDGQKSMPVGSITDSGPKFVGENPDPQAVNGSRGGGKSDSDAGDASDGEDVGDASDESDASYRDSELALLVRSLFQKRSLNVNESDVDEDTNAQVKALLSTVRVKIQNNLAHRIQRPIQSPVPHHNHTPGPRRLGIKKRSQRPVASRPVTKPVTAERNTQRPQPDDTETNWFKLSFSDTLTQAPKPPSELICTFSHFKCHCMIPSRL